MRGSILVMKSLMAFISSSLRLPLPLNRLISEYPRPIPIAEHRRRVGISIIPCGIKPTRTKLRLLSKIMVWEMLPITKPLRALRYRDGKLNT